jgi:hypothetical protein
LEGKKRNKQLFKNIQNVHIRKKNGKFFKIIKLPLYICEERGLNSEVQTVHPADEHQPRHSLFFFFSELGCELRASHL